MSKEVQVKIYIDKDVSSIRTARDRIERAWLKQEDLKGELWGLIMATPKDVVADGEDPINNLKECFNDIWGKLWDAFVDEYKYTVIADDAELNEDSLVAKAWEEERKRKEFFNKYRDVLNPYNFDDCKLYDEFKKGNLIITEPFTAEQRAFHLEQIEKKEKDIVAEAFKQLKEDDK